MIYHLAIACVGIAALAGMWVAVQALARRHSPDDASDPDVLSCRACGAADACGHRASEPDAAAIAEKTRTTS